MICAQSIAHLHVLPTGRPRNLFRPRARSFIQTRRAAKFRKSSTRTSVLLSADFNQINRPCRILASTESKSSIWPISFSLHCLRMHLPKLSLRFFFSASPLIPMPLKPAIAHIHLPHRIRTPAPLRPQPPHHPTAHLVPHPRLIRKLRYLKPERIPVSILTKPWLESHTGRRLREHSRNLLRRLLQHFQQH